MSDDDKKKIEPGMVFTPVGLGGEDDTATGVSSQFFRTTSATQRAGAKTICAR